MSILQNAFSSNTDLNAGETGFDMLSVDSAMEPQQEAEDFASAIQRCEGAMCSLEAISDSIAGCAADGGLGAQGAMFATHAIESAGAAIDLNIELPSLESFDADGGRSTATGYTLEAIGDQLTKIWNAIKKFIKDFIVKVKTYFSKSLSDAGRLEKAANAMSKTAEKADGTPSEKKLEVAGSTAASMRLGTKIKADEVFAGTVDALNDSKLGDTKVIEDLTDLFDDVDEDTNEEKLGAKLTAATKNVKDYISGHPLKMESTTDSRFVSKAGSISYEMGKASIVGNKTMLTTLRTNKDKFKSISISWVHATTELANAKTDKDVKLDALTKQEIVTAFDEVANVAEAVRTSKFDIAKISKELDAYVKSAEAAAKGLEGVEKPGAAVKEMIGTIKAMGGTTTALLESGKGLNMLAMTGAKAHYAFAKRSLSNLKKK